MSSPARLAAESFAGRTYASEAEAIADLERIIASACSDHAADVATALRDVLSTFRHDDREVIVTAERQEAWDAVLKRHDDLKQQSPVH